LSARWSIVSILISNSGWRANLSYEEGSSQRQFHWFKVNNELQFNTLQFADVTVIVGDENWENLWTLKIVLRSFELVFGLKVIFFKSKLYGINLDENFLCATSVFLHCEVDCIPFRFLGIPVGANPQRKMTWNPIVESMRRFLDK
jgi:hypothetical protein